MKSTLLTILLLNISIFYGFNQSITTTKHNLSISGSGIYSDTESEICIFCHTPHNSTPAAPLWNRNDPGATYVLYNNAISSTIQAIPGQPDGSSILCLSCHDGTIALGNVVSKNSDISFVNGITTIPIGSGNLTTDLSDDHPISFIFNSTLTSNDGQLNYPPSFPVTVDGTGKVQCTSCHDPHKNIYSKFLVTTNEYSELCMSCHERNFWQGSSHESSTATWNASGSKPWDHMDDPYPSVAQNACESCHTTHSASGKERLLKSDLEENNCLGCHNGNVASENIEIQLTKTYTHNVYGYTDIHDALESALISAPHIECIDCHNPHNTNNTIASPPYASGMISGVQGIDQDGNAITTLTYEYELCYRCHADNPVTSPPLVRMFVQGNVRLEFDNTSASFHPVAYVGKNPTVPSLYNGWTVASRMYCTHCHASDGTSPSGPHGSIFPQILKAYYNRSPFPDIPAGSFPTEYELCAICHDVENLSHVHRHKQFHILRYTTCNSCHDPHGSDQPYLLNYDPTVMSPNTAGNDFFNTITDNCNLVCHPPGSGLSRAHDRIY